MVNVAAITVSRLSMNRQEQNAFVNDIVSQLGIKGIGFGGPGAFGAPWFNVQGFSGMGDTYAATPMHAWDTVIEGREQLSWQHGHHTLKFGSSYRRYGKCGRIADSRKLLAQALLQCWPAAEQAKTRSDFDQQRIRFT